MSKLFDDASLAMIPSAYKDGKLYSIRPTDGSGDFTFSRGSNLAATRVDVNGLIEKGRENHILHSNAITTSPWSTFRLTSTPTQGYQGYDGSNDAWKVIPNNSNNTHGFVQSVTAVNGVNTISVYAKAAGYDYITIRDDSSGSSYARFDLATGVTSITGSNAITSKMESVGNDWWRCSLTYQETATGNILFYVNNAYNYAGFYVGDEVSGVYFQDFQVEQGLVATDYIETGASTAQAGILEDMPRLDYSGGASCPSLLLEPQRTNEIIFSEYFGSSEWVKRTSDGTAVPVVTDNYAVSPEGVKNASRVVVTKPSTDSDYAVINDNNGIVKSLGDKFTSSVYLKATDASQVGKIVDMYTYESGGGYRAVKSHILTNDWVRLDAIGTFIVSTGNVELINIGKARSSAGGTTLANMATDFLVYGAQFEAGSYPTSYIPNHSGGSVTRGADSCTGAGDATTFNDSEGVLYVEASTLTNGGVSRSVVITDGTDDNLLIIQWNLNLNRMQFFARSGGGAYDVLSINGITQTDVNKIALSWDSVNYYAWINGVKLGTKQFTNVPTGLSELAFGQSAASAFNGNTKQVLVFKEALSDTELIKLTTI